MSFVYCFSQLQISDAWFNNLLAICGFPNFSQYTSSDIHSLEIMFALLTFKSRFTVGSVYVWTTSVGSIF